MANDSKKFKFAVIVIVILLAHYYPYLKNLVYKNFDYLPLNLAEQRENNDYLTIEREIIKSWKDLIQIPNRNLNRKLKIAIGLVFKFIIY